MAELRINQKLGPESIIDFRELGIAVISELYAPEIALAAARETVDLRYFERPHKLPTGVGSAAKAKSREGLRQTATDIVAHRLRRNGTALGLRLDPIREPKPNLTALEVTAWPGLVSSLVIDQQTVALAALRGQLLVEIPDKISFAAAPGEALFVDGGQLPRFKVSAGGEAGIGLLVASR